MLTVITNLIWKFCERIGVQVVSFIVSIVLARMLEPSDYGYIALVMVFISLANVIVEGGLSSALIQRKNSDTIDFSTILFATLSLATIIYVILFFCAPAIGNLYNNRELIKVVRVLGLSLFFNSFNSVQNAYLSKNMQFKKLFLCSVAGVIVSGSVGIACAYSGRGLWALVAQSLTLSVVTTTIMWITVKWRPKLIFSIKRFKTLFNFGWKIFLTNLMTSLFINIRSLIIGKYYSTSSLAYFDRGKSIPSLAIDNINSSIQSVMFPVLSKKQDDKSDVLELLQKSTRMTSYVIFPILMGLLVVADPLVRVLLTDKWLDAVPYIRVFCVAFMLLPIQNINMVAIKALGYGGTTLKLEIIKKTIECLILIVSVQIDVLAIAWGVVLYNAICVGINLAPTKKLLGYGYLQQFADAMPSLILSLVMGGCVYLLGLLALKPLPLLILSIVLGVAVYIILSSISRNESYLLIREKVHSLTLT